MNRFVITVACLSAMLLTPAIASAELLRVQLNVLGMD